MKALTIHDAEDVVFALQGEIRRNDEARYGHRLHALLLVAQGMSGRQVARLLGDAPRTIAYWVNRFEKEGFAGLADAERPGRPCRLNSDQLAELESVLRGEPREYGLQGLWDGKTLSAFVEQRWGILLGVRQCQRLFRRLGFRLRKPRPKIANADIGEQEEYKKNLKYFILMIVLTFGHWMRLGLNSTAHVAACGFHQRSRSHLCCSIQQEKV